MPKEYIIFNRTDGVTATWIEFASEDDAKHFIAERNRALKEHQGYYKTSSGERIDPYDVIYEIVAIDKDQDEDYLTPLLTKQ